MIKKERKKLLWLPYILGIGLVLVAVGLIVPVESGSVEITKKTINPKQIYQMNASILQTKDKKSGINKVVKRQQNKLSDLVGVSDKEKQVAIRRTSENDITIAAASAIPELITTSLRSEKTLLPLAKLGKKSSLPKRQFQERQLSHTPLPKEMTGIPLIKLDGVKSKWSSTPYFEFIKFNYYELAYIDKGDYEINSLLNRSTPMFGISGGIDLAYKINSHLNLITGLSYLQLNEKFQLKTDSTNSIEIQTTQGTATVVDLIERTVRHTNHLGYLEIPLGIEYQSFTNGFHHGFGVGIKYKRMLMYDGILENQKNQLAEYKNYASVEHIYKKNNLSWQIRASFLYDLTDDLILNLQLSHQEDLFSQLKLKTHERIMKSNTFKIGLSYKL